MIRFISLSAVAAAILFTTQVNAQEITPDALCDAGIGNLAGGIGRLACKAITAETLTAEDVVQSLGEPPLEPPLLQSEFNFGTTPYAEVGPTPTEASEPCAIPDSLECEYQRILDDLDARYGTDNGGAY